MRHNWWMRSSADIVNELVSRDLPHDELAARLRVARETVSRWSTGTNEPSLDSLRQAAAAAGFQLEVHLESAEPKLVVLVHDQLDLGPTDRLKALLGARWPACRDALRAAAAVGELGVLVGPVAAALNGAPQRPGDGRVDLLVVRADEEVATERLLRYGAHPDGVEQAAAGPCDERRERWQTGEGLVTVRAQAAGIDDIGALRDRALPAMLPHSAVGAVHVALVEDLARIAAASPWSDDAIYLPGLRAVLASGRSPLGGRRTKRCCSRERGRERHRQLLGILVSHDVEFVLVGGVALQLHGFSGATLDVDVTISVDERNAIRVACAPEQLHAAPYLAGERGSAYPTDLGQP